MNDSATYRVSYIQPWNNDSRAVKCVVRRTVGTVLLTWQLPTANFASSDYDPHGDP